MRSLIALTVAMAGLPAAVAEETQLDTVQVTHQQAYRGDLADFDKPQAIEVLDASVLDQVPGQDFQTALDLSSSVSAQNSLGGLWDSFSLRGFPGNENVPSGYLINGFNGGRGFSGRRDMSNVDYIEVIKGPGSALYGRGEPGGTVNIVTLKPQFSPAGKVQATAGSYHYKRLEGDYTGALSEQLAGRVNGAVVDSDSFRDEVFMRKKTLSPSLLFQASDTTSLLYEGEYLKHEQLFDRGIVVLNNDFDTVPRSRYLGEPDDGATEVGAFGHQLSLTHTLANGWNVNAGYNHRRSWLSGASSDAELSTSRQSLYTDGETLTRQRRVRDYQTADHSLRAELSGSTEIAGITHHLLLGADAYRYRLDQNMDRYRGAAGSYAINIYDPQYGQTQPDTTPLNRNHELQHGRGIYAQDQMQLTQQLALMAGLRVDDYWQSVHEKLNGTPQSHSGKVYSPRAGITYAFNDGLQVYASHSRGFMPLSGSNADGEGFDPERSRSNEIGVKALHGSWQTTLAVFDAVKSNILTADANGFSVQLGEARSTGAELDTAGMLTDSLSMRLSYAWLDTRTTRDMINADWGVTIEKGSQLINVPEHKGSLLLTQQMRLAEHDASASLLVKYTGERLGETINPDYVLPDYWLVDIKGTLALTPQLSTDLTVSNLFDEFYIDNSYSALWTLPGEPRSVKAGLTYEF